MFKWSNLDSLTRVLKHYWEEKESFLFPVSSSLKCDTNSFIDFCPLNINVIISLVLFSYSLAISASLLFNTLQLSFYIMSLIFVRFFFLVFCVFLPVNHFTFVYMQLGKQILYIEALWWATNLVIMSFLELFIVRSGSFAWIFKSACSKTGGNWLEKVWYYDIKWWFPIWQRRWSNERRLIITLLIITNSVLNR